MTLVSTHSGITVQDLHVVRVCVHLTRHQVTANILTGLFQVDPSACVRAVDVTERQYERSNVSVGPSGDVSGSRLCK